MKVQINKRWLNEIEMMFFDTPGTTSLLYPQHRVEIVVCIQSQLVLKIPQPLVIQLFMDKLISADTSFVSEIEISKMVKGKYYLEKILFTESWAKAPAYVYFKPV